MNKNFTQIYELLKVNEPFLPRVHSFSA
uniref:Uncharacterized protein n=1 Tax=Tetranychus urticae TaxID=32264 RepID=T1L2Z1_TETUR